MTFEQFVEIAALPMMGVCILLYYGIRLLVEKNISIINKNSSSLVKDEKVYAKKAGELILFLAFSMVLMTALLFWSVYAAILIIVILVIIFAVLWSRMNRKYGR